MRKKNTLSPADLKKLFKVAADVRKKAHAPYSGFQIGAALVTADGKIHSGCNVENASYGGTVCAERVAIFKAVSEGLKTPIREICVVSPATTPWPPCGFCRQVLAEFADGETLIHLANLKGIVRTMKFGELFPESFNPKFLK